MSSEITKLDKGKKRSSITSVNNVLLLVTFLLFILFFVNSLSLSKTAGLVPRLVTGAGIILCVVQVILQAGKVDDKSQEQEKSQGLKWYIHLLLILLYLASLILIGFPISTFLYLAVLPALLGYKKWKVNLTFSVITTVILYYSFVNFFYVRLPEGIILKLFTGN